MMKPLILSPPRTRSTILYETMAPYVAKNSSLLPSVGHSEPFLHLAQNKIIDGYATEIHPILTKKCIEYKYVFPRVFEDNKDSVLKKLDLFRSAKKEGREYFFKATLNVAVVMSEFLEVFEDRDLYLTLRKKPEDIFVSTAYAMAIKIFHARESNLNTYKSYTKSKMKISQSVLELIDWMVEMVSVFYDLPNRIKNISVIYYNEMNCDQEINNKISKIFNTDKWIDTKPSNLPIKIDNDYKSIIENYDELMSSIEVSMKKHFRK